MAKIIEIEKSILNQKIKVHDVELMGKKDLAMPDIIEYFRSKWKLRRIRKQESDFLALLDQINEAYASEHNIEKGVGKTNKAHREFLSLLQRDYDVVFFVGLLLKSAILDLEDLEREIPAGMTDLKKVISKQLSVLNADLKRMLKVNLAVESLAKGKEGFADTINRMMQAKHGTIISYIRELYDEKAVMRARKHLKKCTTDLKKAIRKGQKTTEFSKRVGGELDKAFSGALDFYRRINIALEETIMGIFKLLKIHQKAAADKNLPLILSDESKAVEKHLLEQVLVVTHHRNMMINQLSTEQSTAEKVLKKGKRAA